MFNFSDENCHVEARYDNHKTDYFKPGNLEAHNWAWIVAGFCVVLACLLSFYLIFKHLRNYTQPEFQKHIVRIILMVPIYGIDSFFSFRFYWLSIYFDIIRDCYEAFVIYTFYSLLISFMGGYDHGKKVIAKRGKVTLVFPLNCIQVDPKRGLIRNLKRLTLQYVIIRPSMTTLAIILHSVFHEYCPGNYSPYHGYLYITIVNFFSVTIAMYALVQFYSLTKLDIAQYKPIPKFLSVKMVIFMSFWQSVAVSGFVAIHGIRETTYWSTDNIATGIQNACLCFEMLLAAIVHIWAFSYHEYETETRKTSICSSAADCFNPYDIAIDVYQSFFPHAFRGKTKTKGREVLVSVASSVELADQTSEKELDEEPIGDGAEHSV